MNLEYNASLHDERCYIDNGNCAEKLGYPLEELAAITGIYGIVKRGDPMLTFDVRGLYPNVTVEVRHSVMKLELKVQVLFKARTLYDEYFIICKDLHKKGNALRMMDEQIRHAKASGFLLLRTLALRDVNTPNCIGYYICVKLGWLPAGIAAKTMEKFGRGLRIEFRNMPELIADDRFRESWRSSGETWSAVFDLADDSESMKAFAKYKQDKEQARR